MDLPARSTPTPGATGAPPPLWVPVIAGLPITLCMFVLGLPEMNHANAMAYRAIYIVAYLVASVLLAVVQRRLWRTRASWWTTVVLLVVLTYAMSLATNAVAIAFAVRWGQLGAFAWALIFRDGGAWISLIAFCAIHTVVGYYAELRHAQEHAFKAQALAREAELRALRYQLNPHFLFNSLNAISTLVATGAVDEANQMLARLSDLLRATLVAREANEISVAEELVLTQAYLDVEKVRLGRRLQARMHIGADVMSAMLPYLLLQPLVENAIRHGIARREVPGRLDVSIERAGDRLRIAIRNDGSLARREENATSDESRIGLSNTRARLAHLYPHDHAIEADHLAGGGYAVAIDVPYREGRRMPADAPS